MKLLMTGTTGFIGTHLAKRLVADGHEVHALVRNQVDISGVQAHVVEQDVAKLILWMQHETFDGVIHLASLFLARHEAKDVAQLVDSNVLFGTLLLEASVQAQVPWFINTGTFWQHYENKSYSPVNLYAATKQAFEDIARYYVEALGFHFATLKLSDTFGPQDPRPKIFALWDKMSKSGETMDMSPGEQLIDISYIENVIDAYVRLIELMAHDESGSLAGKSFAVSSGERMTLRQLAGVFERVTGKKLQINWGKREYRPREVMVPWEKGELVPGWKPRFSLEEGIRKTYHG